MIRGQSIKKGLLIMRIKELSYSDRPYEKLENYGASILSDSELLAIILKTGTKDKTVLEIAQEHEVVLSLANGMRAGSISYSTDRAQIQELIILGELIFYLSFQLKNLQR